jgi:hypothetical protein
MKPFQAAGTCASAAPTTAAGIIDVTRVAPIGIRANHSMGCTAPTVGGPTGARIRTRDGVRDDDVLAAPPAELGSTTGDGDGGARRYDVLGPESDPGPRGVAAAELAGHGPATPVRTAVIKSSDPVRQGSVLLSPKSRLVHTSSSRASISASRASASSQSLFASSSAACVPWNVSGGIPPRCSTVALPLTQSGLHLTRISHNAVTGGR